jgi:Mn-dependent DtxR family transcriptional regulator
MTKRPHLPHTVRAAQILDYMIAFRQTEGLGRAYPTVANIAQHLHIGYGSVTYHLERMRANRLIELPENTYQSAIITAKGKALVNGTAS